jgi:hypothetical protein
MNEHTLDIPVHSCLVSLHHIFALMNVNLLNIVDALGCCLILAYVLNFRQRILLMTLIPVNDSDCSSRRVFYLWKIVEKNSHIHLLFFPYIFSILLGSMNKKSVFTFIMPQSFQCLSVSCSLSFKS